MVPHTEETPDTMHDHLIPWRIVRHARIQRVDLRVYVLIKTDEKRMRGENKEEDFQGLCASGLECAMQHGLHNVPYSFIVVIIQTERRRK